MADEQFMSKYAQRKGLMVEMPDGTVAERFVAAKDNQLIVSTTITSGATVSGTIDLGPYRAVGLSMPAAFTGASVTFQSSFDGTNFVPVYKDGALVTEAVGTSRRIVLDPAKFYGIRYLRVVSGSSEAADRVITVIAEC